MGEWILTSSILMIVVMVLRCTLKGRIKLRMRYGLWLIVLLRLLIPFSLMDSHFSVMNAVYRVRESAAETSLGQIIDEMGEWPVPMMGYDRAYEEALNAYEDQGLNLSELSSGQREELEHEVYERMTGPSVKEVLRSTFLFIWAAGMVVVGGGLLASNLRFAEKLRGSREKAEEIGSGFLPVYVSELVETPCLFGVMRPAVYLSETVFADKASLRYVLEHENTHYRHGDHIWSLLRCVCLVIHWYNPLVWMAAYLSRRDGELACDEATIRRIGEAKRIDYGRVIIELSCGNAGAKSLFTAATTMVGGESDLKERILLIAKKSRTAIWAGVAAAVVMILAVSCLFTGGKVKTDGAESEAFGNEKEYHDFETVYIDVELDHVDALYYSYALGDGAMISLYLDNGVLYKTYPVLDLGQLENLARCMAYVDWSETDVPAKTTGKRVVISSINGQHSMTFYLEGENVVSYYDGENIIYWQTTPTENTYLLFSDSINAYARRIYDNVEESARKVMFYGTGGAETVAEQFAENVLRDYYLGRVPGGWNTSVDYDVIEWSLADVSEEEKTILGWIRYGVKPEDPTPRTASFWAGGSSVGEGKYEGWVLYTTQFLLEQQENGAWSWNMGYYGKSLDGDLHD